MLPFLTLRWRLVPVCASCLFFFSFAALGQQSAASKITIESSWGGFGDPAHLKLVLQASVGKVNLGEKVIESNRIETLLAAFRATALSAPQASNLGITGDWLHQYASAISEDGAPNQQALFEETFSDPGTMEQLLPSLFTFWRSDDYPCMRVTVAFANGQRWVAASDSYYPFMLPWTVDLNRQKQTKTYNADISRAIAALMPAGSLNRDRLSDVELKKELADAVMSHVKDQRDFLGVENRAPDSFAILRHNFEVKHARIDPYRSVDHGYIGNELGPHEENLLATLQLLHR